MCVETCSQREIISAGTSFGDGKEKSEIEVESRSNENERDSSSISKQTLMFCADRDPSVSSSSKSRCRLANVEATDDTLFQLNEDCSDFCEACEFAMLGALSE